MRAVIAFCCVISLLCPPALLWAADATGGILAPKTTELCFPVEDAERILKDLEALPACQDAVQAVEYVLKSTEEIAKAQEERIVEQDRELKDARKLVDDTRKAGEEAAKLASGPWYQRVLNAGKWIGLGILVGFVGGVAK